MTLIENILKKVQSKDSLRTKYSSPPPELSEDSLEKRVYKKKKKPIVRYPHVRPRVDSDPPRLQQRALQTLAPWSRTLHQLYMDNFQLVLRIKAQHYSRGRVDSHWDHPLEISKKYFEKRKTFMQQVQTDNKAIYERILAVKARVTTTASLERSWQRNRERILFRAELPFVLFPPDPQEDIDPVFLAPAGVVRPRVRLCLRVDGGARLGWLTIELFSDVCPLTCQLFTELLKPGKYSYIGSCFFTKVPHLYWSGGDVVHNNGSGCYLQPGRLVPLTAENYHYPHSMPGLLSMRMTCDDEMCGIFNITFKPLPQFDLKNVVFARIVRPNDTYNVMQGFGSAFNTQPVVRIESVHFLKNRKPGPVATCCKDKSLELLEQTALMLQLLPSQ